MQVVANNVKMKKKFLKLYSLYYSILGKNREDLAYLYSFLWLNAFNAFINISYYNITQCKAYCSNLTRVLWIFIIMKRNVKRIIPENLNFVHYFVKSFYKCTPSLRLYTQVLYKKTNSQNNKCCQLHLFTASSKAIKKRILTRQNHKTLT